MGINVPGKTDEERRIFAVAYRMGMFDAARAVRDLAKEAGEVAGSGNAPFTVAADHIERRMPKGEIVTTHELR